MYKALTVVVTVVFFVGGYIDPTATKPEPKFTDLLFGLMYGALALTVAATVGFAVKGFASSFSDAKRRKNALAGLISLVAIVALLGITYVIGGTDHLALGVDFQKYNTDHFLKFSDMWLYSIYVVLALNVVALIAFGIKGAIEK